MTYQITKTESGWELEIKYSASRCSIVEFKNARELVEYLELNF